MQRVISGSVVYYQFEGLRSYAELAHGVFTRLGGQSRPPWDSLNTGHTIGDDPVAVEANHHLICQALGFRREDIVSPYQVHGAVVGVVDVADRGRVRPQTDALVTDAPGVLLMLRFADCVPVWFYDPSRRAIGLAHAGWRGTVAGIVRATVKEMERAFGCLPSDLIAGLGPAIGPCCYEVGEDVARAADEARVDLSPFLEPVPNGRWHLDLWAANRHQLRQAGVLSVEIAGICTACHTDEWFSHRVENGRTGRLGAVIGLRGVQTGEYESEGG